MSPLLRAFCMLLLSITLLPVAEAQQGPTLSVAERTLPSGTVFADYADAAIYLRGLINAGSDAYGNLTIDMGSFSAGRCMFNLSDVVLAIEKRDAEPGCSEMCPPRAIISMECSHGPCAADPFMKDMKHNTCSFTLFDHALGDHVYETLRIMQRFLRKG